MKTTVDLPDDLYAIAASLAHDRGCALGAAVVDLVRRGIRPTIPLEDVEQRTGFPLLSSGRLITSDDVRQLYDD